MARDLNIFDHIRVIFRYRWMIFPVCVIAVLATGAICYFWPPSFVATASIVPPMESAGGDSGFGMGLLGGNGASLLRSVMDVSSVADMYVGIMESRAVTDTILDKFDLMQVYDVDGARYKARRKLKKNTNIKVSEEGIVYVAVEDEDPNRAAALANAYVDELDRQNKRLSVGQTTSKRVFLETRLSEMEQRLSQAEDIPKREQDIQEVLYELLMRELELAKMEEAKSMPTIQVLDPAVPPERRKAKGTIRKAVLAGIMAFILTAFIAFTREYYKACGKPQAQAYGQTNDGDDLNHTATRPTDARESRIAVADGRRRENQTPIGQSQNA